MSDKPKYCPNCGGFLDESGQCKFCGSKIFEGTKPEESKCDCVYDKVEIAENIRYCRADLFFKCGRCGKTLKVPISTELLRNVLRW